MTPKQWTPDEETALGRCFMDESENKTKDFFTYFFFVIFYFKVIRKNVKTFGKKSPLVGTG
ncbi:hypothetical protein R6Q57_006083 [Mikania cordata]